LSNNVFVSFRNYTYQIFLLGIFIQIGIKMIYNKLGMRERIRIFMYCASCPGFISQFLSRR